MFSIAACLLLGGFSCSDQRQKDQRCQKDQVVAGKNTQIAAFKLRVFSCKLAIGEFPPETQKRDSGRQGRVVLELVDDRNALERAMLHFAHFEKQAEKINSRTYRITIHYDKDDETELVIRVLSFGPMIRVVEPETFIRLIRERLMMQKSCEHI